MLTAAESAQDAALVPKAAAIVDAFTNSGARLLGTGSFVFNSNRDGLPSLYVADAAHPKAAPRKLPTPNERVQSATILPDERTVLFTSDVGADRKFRIFRVGIDGSGLENLTPGETLDRSPPIVAS
ncbi:MAG TPA: hypothetical protein VNO21_27430, partial [Polyangiaceae bacterium]|nr:hypothetical protein [Polyangiaceae bacterium]